MRVTKRTTLLIISLLLLFFIFLFYKKDPLFVSKNDLGKLKSFDLVLASGQSIQSKIVHFVGFSSDSYSHIGIVIKKDFKTYVLHSTPDGTDSNSIRFDDFQTFLNLSDVHSYRILRFDTLQNTKSLESEISYYKSNSFPFDFSFDNYDKEKIYCTELVYDIFKKTGDLKSSIHQNEIMLPKDFINLPELKTVLIKSTSQH